MGLLSPALLQLVEDHHCQEILELVHHQEGSLGKKKSFVKNERGKKSEKRYDMWPQMYKAISCFPLAKENTQRPLSP